MPRMSCRKMLRASASLRGGEGRDMTGPKGQSSSTDQAKIESVSTKYITGEMRGEAYQRRDYLNRYQ